MHYLSRTLLMASVLVSMVALSLIQTDRAEAQSVEVRCSPHYSGESADGWISDGLALAGLPDDPGRHGALKSQAWQESRFTPAVVNDWDANAIVFGTPSVGLLQVVAPTWHSTQIGKEHPFIPCATDPVISAGVRAQLFERGDHH